MKLKRTTALEKIIRLGKRIKVIQGGSSSAKTFSILMVLIEIAQTERNKTISVVSESFPHLRRGAIKDFLDILEADDDYDDEAWSKTNFTYSFPSGSKIEFFSVKEMDKVRGPRRDILFVNEANNISFETYTQLAIRTNGDIYLDYNPVSEFWVNTDLMAKSEHDFIILTYKDNEALSEVIVKEIESRRDNKYFWQVYGMGQLGVAEGRIYKDWQIISEIEFEAKYLCTGLDFGYTQDPSVIADIYYLNGGYIVDEVAYDRQLSNRQLADILLGGEEKRIVYADSAEPKSIDEIKGYGVSIFPAAKGKDSVSHGIQLVQGQRISITARSVRIIKDYRNYLWKEGAGPNIPSHEFSHGMDAVRYGLVSSLVIGGSEEEFDRKYRQIPFYDQTVELWRE